MKASPSTERGARGRGSLRSLDPDPTSSTAQGVGRAILRRDTLIVALLWAALTAIGEVLVVTWDLFPLAAAREATVVDDAFRVLLIMAVPVFTFVLAVLLYGIPRFRRRGGPLEDGPPIHTHSRVIGAWFVVTTGLTLLVILFPGVTGLTDLRSHDGGSHGGEEADLVVQVKGGQWFWQMTYPEYGVTAYQELVVPLGQRVRFEVSSIDVLHAFWVPAFRVKIDAVPGRVTEVHATPDKLGAFDDDYGFRLQCAELCGLGHGLMAVPVRVVEPAEFETWVARQLPTP